MEDREAIDRIREQRDPEAFQLLVVRYKEPVLRLVTSVLGSGLMRDAEDVVQEVFLRVHRKIGLFRGDSAFSTWLYRITYNTAIDHRRQRARREDLLEDGLLERQASVEPGLSRSERREIFRQVERLPDPYRAAIYLHYWYGMTLVEIGELLGARPNTVKTYLFRARHRLGRALESGDER